MVRTCSVVAAGLVLLSACSGAGSGPDAQAATSVAAPSDGGGGTGGTTTQATLTVMTRNLYLGADIRRIAAATQPSEIPAAAGSLYQMIRATDFVARAESLADEIGTATPHLVALEEVSLYRTGPPNACVGSQVPATDVWLDFLQILQDALAARSLDYVVALQVENFDAQLCTQVGAETFADVRLTDRDVILVRGDVTFANPRSGRFTSMADFPAGGASLAIPRGWGSVDVASPIGDLRFVATHLEVEGFATVQQAQAAELATEAADGLGTMPLIVAGDFNAGPELATVTSSYDDLLAAGFKDPWPDLFPTDPGPTCCFDEDLLGGSLTQRIDLTLYRGNVVPTTAARVGLEQNTEPGLYPSDHAGVITTFAASDGGECPPEDDPCACECRCDRDCDRGHDRDCDRGHDRDCDRDHDRDCDRDHDRDCDRDHDRDCDRDHDRDCDRDHDRDRDRNCDRDREHGDRGEEHGCDGDQKVGSPACSEKSGGKDRCREHRDCGRHLGWCHRRCDRDCGQGGAQACDEKGGSQACSEKNGGKDRCREHRDCGRHLGWCHRRCERDRGQGGGQACDEKGGGKGCSEKSAAAARR